jgi:hypothetical protein
MMTPVTTLVALATAWSVIVAIPLRVVVPDKRPMPVRIQLRRGAAAAVSPTTARVACVAESKLLIKVEILNAPSSLKIRYQP